MPDDLDDDFNLDHSLAPLSDGEDIVLPETSTDGNAVDPEELNDQGERKRKKRIQGKARKRQKLDKDSDSVELSIADQTPDDLSIYLSFFQAKSMSGLSSLELEDIRIPGHSIVDTRMWDGARALETLVEFIIKVLPTLHVRLGQRPKYIGAPTLIFIAGAASRVADVTRVLKDGKLRGERGGEVAKLFAKHFKLTQHIAYLKRTRIAAAVGTPGRIGKLLRDTDALSVSALTHIILDLTHRDAKQRRLFDIQETRDDVFRSLLTAPELVKGIRERKIQLVLF